VNAQIGRVLDKALLLGFSDWKDCRRLTVDSSAALRNDNQKNNHSKRRSFDYASRDEAAIGCAQDDSF
jgi:hypothetical protein